jgi:hypothetical protein
VLQVKSDITVPPYVKGGRAYQTTPAKCPASGIWASTVKLWWADGSVDTVGMRQPCTRAKAKPKPKKRRPKKRRHR